MLISSSLDELAKLKLLIFAVVFAVVALGTSCSKPSEKKIIGKWQLVSEQYRDSYDPEWDIDYYNDEVIIAEFKSDGTCNIYEDGELDDVVTWSFDKSNQKIIFYGESFDISFPNSKEMVWNYKYTWSDGDWEEEQMNWKKVK